MNLKIFPPERAVSAGPGLKAAQAVIEFRCSTIEINKAIFSAQDRSQRGVLLILTSGIKASVLQGLKGLDHHVSTHIGEAWSERYRGVFPADLYFGLLKDISGVEARVNPHGGHTGDGLAI